MNLRYNNPGISLNERNVARASTSVLIGRNQGEKEMEEIIEQLLSVHAFTLFSFINTSFRPVSRLLLSLLGTIISFATKRVSKISELRTATLLSILLYFTYSLSFLWSMQLSSLLWCSKYSKNLRERGRELMLHRYSLPWNRHSSCNHWYRFKGYFLCSNGMIRSFFACYFLYSGNQHSVPTPSGESRSSSPLHSRKFDFHQDFRFPSL